ncbi:DUF3991 domain-containing protein [Agrobacterium tumefaciens]|nr:DUF3991 domain-containing protein [Agrobacterium tumefaciens]NSY99609.1 DUF3991 domain-containing protein [Agrobacterium tumefaciens]NSZ36362.1 DUF3991 domain-containing protein [Agrobacterium tumefaciens]NTB21878.1 DUF3991 domain-containing protein [Agrobacterium tumefaciens]NTB31776.1 DUF3991 domain-containing protein [Agrobacterium tumefaciens]NTB32257.1 DUF3991 domain-containing protein [Agrobacterium tumefaciens]
MEKKEVEELKSRVFCAAVLEKAGYTVDLKESTRRAVKYRRGDDIVIVIHNGKGWFDPLSDAKGDVFSLIRNLHGLEFTEAIECAAELVGFIPSEPAWIRPARDREPQPSLAKRWWARRTPWRGSATWRYLAGERFLPESVLQAAIRQDRLREGPYGSMWAAHVDDDGAVTGWEERGPDWRGFSTGGAKDLFRLGTPDAVRLCVTEAAIDAMSLAAFEGLRERSLYLSTGGGWSPTTEAAVRALAARADAQLVAATDDNPQGEAFADRLREIAQAAGCDWVRLKPPAEDWNDAWRAKGVEERKRRERKSGLPHARRPRQG